MIKANSLKYRSEKRGHRIEITIVVMLSVALAALFIFPYAYMALSSFKPSQEVISIPPTMFPSHFSMENYIKMFNYLPVMKYLENSFLIAILATLLAVVFGSLSSYAIARSGSKLSTVLLVLVLCLKMIPLSSISVPIYQIVNQLHLYDTQAAMILVLGTVNMPFVMWIMIGFYEGIPVSLDEAACMDGASSFTTFFKIIVPTSTPGLVSTSIFTLFLCWNDFLFGLLLTSTNAKTFTVGLSEFLTAYNLDLGPMTAAAFMFSFPVMILSIFAQKYIVKGITAGAVKG